MRQDPLGLIAVSGGTKEGCGWAALGPLSMLESLPRPFGSCCPDDSVPLPPSWGLSEGATWL